MEKTLLLSCDFNIYIYNNDYYADLRGTPDFFDRYLRVFDKLRLVLRTKNVGEEPGRGYYKVDKNRVEIWPFPFFSGPKQYAQVFFKGKKAMYGVTNNCDVAVLRLPSTTAYQVLPYVLKNKLPYAVEVVSDPFDAMKVTSKSINKYYFWRWYKDLQKACKYADGVACVTREYLQQRYHPSKANAVTANYSSVSLHKNLYAAPKSFPQKKSFEVIHTANNVTYGRNKGHKELIEVISILNKKDYDVYVNFLGKDYDNGFAKLTEYATTLGVQDKVKFSGFVASKADLMNCLHNADLFVLPTKVEGLSRSVIEAMAVGLPTITTNVAGNPELIQKDFLVDDFNDVENIAQKIINLISNPQLYEATSKYNFENSKNYEASVLEAKRDEFYKRLKDATE